MRRILVGLAAVTALALALGLWAFEPWRLFTSSEVDEAAPHSAPRVPATTPARRPATSRPATPPPADRVIATGEFVDAEHDTSGTAKILLLADGRRFVRLESLASSDGPDLHVWLSEARSGGGWGSYDDGEHVRLGNLKATRGNQNYAIPADVDLSAMRSVVIWCDRFNVAFGSAPIRVG